MKRKATGLGNSGRSQAVHILGKHHLSLTTVPFIPTTLGSSCNHFLETVPGSSESGHLEDGGPTTPLLLVQFHLHLLHISPLFTISEQGLLIQSGKSGLLV